jgi:hypothetical protein
MLPYATKATNTSANRTSMRGMRTFSPLQMGREAPAYGRLPSGVTRLQDASLKSTSLVLTVPAVRPGAVW